MTKLFRKACAVSKSVMIAMALSCASTLAFAAGGHEQAHGKPAGLPQLNTATFSSQIFWMLVVLAVSYYVFSKKVLPKIEKVLDHRAGLISDDLAKAENLSRMANAAKQSLEETLRIARTQAKKAIETAQAESSHLIGQSIHDADLLLHNRLEESDKIIQAEKARVLKEFHTLVTPVVQDAVQKIIGVDLPEKRVATLLDQELQQIAQGQA